MRVIPVLDVRRGQAVRAIAGDRAHYGPLRSVLHGGTDPIALARAFREAWSLPELYLADLDAILGEAPPSLELFRALADLGLTSWVDAGVRESDEVASLMEAGVGRVILGLETIRGPRTLETIVNDVGPDAVAFSLDLHQGRPMVDTLPTWGTDRAVEIARLAIEAGVRRIILLDLARVGTGLGVPGPVVPLTPGIEWVTGGGVSGIEDVHSLGQAGFDGILVGSALHDGRITSEDLKWRKM